VDARPGISAGFTPSVSGRVARLDEIAQLDLGDARRSERPLRLRPVPLPTILVVDRHHDLSERPTREMVERRRQVFDAIFGIDHRL
jgi:hypothetical protein